MPHINYMNCISEHSPSYIGHNIFCKQQRFSEWVNNCWWGWQNIKQPGDQMCWEVWKQDLLFSQAFAFPWMFSTGMLDSNTWKQCQPNLKAVYLDSLASFFCMWNASLWRWGLRHGHWDCKFSGESHSAVLAKIWIGNELVPGMTLCQGQFCVHVAPAMTFSKGRYHAVL